MAKGRSFPEISDYDASGYDYIKYWEGRQYEHLAEVVALKKLFGHRASGDLVDLGGGYGRLLSFYAPLFDKKLIFDYSSRHLEQARLITESLDLSGVEFRQGDVYQLPWKDESFDTALMVRVMHHLEQPESVFAEVYRILRPGGYFILEFPNKNHLKALFRHFFRGKWQEIFNRKPLVQSAAGEDGIFYNFHWRYVHELLEEAGFLVEKKISVSNLRSPFLKKMMGDQTLLRFEKWLQLFFSPFNLGPSIFVRSRKR